MENLKIEKGKTYTYDEIKEIYQNAMVKTMSEPTGDRFEDDSDFKLSMILSGIVLFHTMEDNMFEKEKNEDE